MAVMIACSPSTGSSLLRRILNRHPEIFCGSESSILAKAPLYSDWAGSKHKIISTYPFRLRDSSWHHFRGLNLDEEYDLTAGDTDQMIKASDSFKGFLNTFYRRVLDSVNKVYWIEKTPSNAFTASLFLEHFENGKLIHIVRDPYDTIASLVNRGMDLYQACVVYLLNCSQLLELLDNPRHHLIRYEELVNAPEHTMRKALEFLGIEYDSSIFEIREDVKGVTRMDGWAHDETKAIGNKSVSRFDRLEAEEKERIKSYCDLLESNLHTEHKSIADICRRLSYAYRPSGNSDAHIKALKSERFRDIIRRTIKMSYFKFNNYPISIVSGKER